MTALQAKFKREAKERPIDWIIAPDLSRGGLRLVYIGVSKPCKKQK